MIGTIYIALTGLNGFERGLRVISNNTANLNTPGFKSSTLQFVDLVPGDGQQGTPGGQYGLGLNTLGTVMLFKPGELRTTDNDLDLAIDGAGLFTLRDRDGAIHYTRDGQFKFDANGILVSSSTEEQVMAFDANGALVPVSIANARVQYAQPTQTVRFGGTLSTAMPTVTVSNVNVIDRAGGSHALSVRFDQVTGTPGAWTVTVLNGTNSIGTGQIAFSNGQPVAAQSTVSFNLQVAGQADMPVTLDFSTNTLSFDYGDQSSMAVSGQDGNAPGSLQGTSFDAQGALVLTYTNGQTVRGARLALARFDSTDAVRAIGDNEYEAVDPNAWVHGYAGQNGFGNVRSARLEMSNVDLSSQFSDLVIMQRGYQASSQIVATANEMLADLFAMKK